MMKPKLSILVFLCFLTELSVAFSQHDKDKLFANIKSQFSNLQLISMDFYLEDNTVKGNLLAKKGNKYIISFGNRKIISDGKTIWNYNPANKNVIVSNFETDSETASIENLFFSFANSFKPSKLYKNSSSNGYSEYFLELIPANKDESNLDMIKLMINPSTKVISGVILIKNYSEEAWLINSLKLNPEVDDKKFKFSPADNIEIIDLR